MTIPRMELCGAHLMSQMCQQICDAHNVTRDDLTLWIDSSIVIHWLGKCPAGMKTFVGNRIAEAQELTKGAQCRHVRTRDNPADLASRGMNADELITNKFGSVVRVGYLRQNKIGQLVILSWIETP